MEHPRSRPRARGDNPDLSRVARAVRCGVLITGVGTLSTGYQVYKALRLGRRQYDLSVANTRLSDLVVAPDARHVCLPPADHRDYIASLAEAADRVTAQFIVPGSDAELLRISRDEAELRRLSSAIPLMNNAATIRTCTDRHATAQAIAAAGARVPVTLDCATADEAVHSLLRFPIVVKPRYGGGGSANVFVAQDATELRFFANYVLRGGSPVVLQEYVGDPESEYTIGVLSFPDGAIGGSLALRRELSGLLSVRFRVPNRSRRPELGPMLVISSGFTQGHVDDYATVRAAAERIARAVRSTGPVNIQGRLVGSEFIPFEINPRFSGTTSMRAMAGWNGPESLIDWHLGCQPGIASYTVTRMRFVRGLEEYAGILDSQPAQAHLRA